MAQAKPRECVDLEPVEVNLEDCDEVCEDCADCRAGCCPIWVKFCTEVWQFNSTMIGPAGSIPTWTYQTVEEAVEQGWVNPADNDTIYYGPHTFRGHRADQEYVTMYAVCNPLSFMNLTVHLEEYRNGLNNISMSYSSSGSATCSSTSAGNCNPGNSATTTCNEWRCWDPVWLGGFYGWPSLVYQGNTKAFSHDPAAGVPAGADPDCCASAGFNYGCTEIPAAAIAHVGGYEIYGLKQTGGSADCFIQCSAQTTTASQGGTALPAGIVVFPGFDPVLDHSVCTPDPLPKPFPEASMTAAIDCDGVVSASVLHQDNVLCNSIDPCNWPNPDCPNWKRQSGTFTSAPGQTLPYSGTIETEKTILWVTRAGTIVQGPDPHVHVSFTIEAMP